jgi:hypothetical protein
MLISRPSEQSGLVRWFSCGDSAEWGCRRVTPLRPRSGLSGARRPARLALRSIAGRGLGVSKMKRLMLIDRLKVFGEPDTARNKRAYFCT